MFWVLLKYVLYLAYILLHVLSDMNLILTGIHMTSRTLYIFDLYLHKQSSGGIKMPSRHQKRSTIGENKFGMPFHINITYTLVGLHYERNVFRVTTLALQLIAVALCDNFNKASTSRHYIVCNHKLVLANSWTNIKRCNCNDAVCVYSYVEYPQIHSRLSDNSCVCHHCLSV